MKRQLRDFLGSSPRVVLDEDGEYRISKTAVNSENNLVHRYYLPNKRERFLILTHVKNNLVKEVCVYKNSEKETKLFEKVQEASNKVAEFSGYPVAIEVLENLIEQYKQRLSDI